MQKTISLIVLLILASSIFAQSPSNAFSTKKHSINTSLLFTKLNEIGKSYMSSSPTSGINIGYNYSINIAKWYTFSPGIQIGWQNYNIFPLDSEYSISISKSRVTKITIPFLINRYFPFNKKHGIFVGSGVNLSKTISSLANFGSVDLMDRELYSTTASINSLPQFGVLFDIGLTYAFKNNNFISYGVNVNKNLNPSITVDYFYYPNDSSNPETGQLISSEFFIGFKFAYHFKSFNNE